MIAASFGHRDVRDVHLKITRFQKCIDFTCCNYVVMFACLEIFRSAMIWSAWAHCKEEEGPPCADEIGRVIGEALRNVSSHILWLE